MGITCSSCADRCFHYQFHIQIGCVNCLTHIAIKLVREFCLHHLALCLRIPRHPRWCSAKCGSAYTSVNVCNEFYLMMTSRTPPPCIVQTGLEEWLVQLELERKLIGAVQLEAGNKALTKRTRDWWARNVSTRSPKQLMFHINVNEDLCESFSRALCMSFEL